MESKELFYKSIENHLNKKGGLIAVTQGNKKLQKNNTNIFKFNWSKQDVLNEALSVQEFIESLPQKGFNSGSVLSLRRVHGNTTSLEGEIILNFKDETAQSLSNPNQESSNINHNYMQSNNNAPQNQPPVNGLAYAQMPTHEVIDMKVKLMRYEDLVDKLKRAEDDLSATKLELHTTKETLISTERKLETINDKHDLEKERIETSRKTFFDTDTGKEVVGALAGRLPEILEAFKPRQAVGMGNPLAGLSELKQQCAATLKDIPDEAIPLLMQTKDMILSIDGFAETLQRLINNVQQNQS